VHVVTTELLLPAAGACRNTVRWSSGFHVWLPAVISTNNLRVSHRLLSSHLTITTNPLPLEMRSNDLLLTYRGVWGPYQVFSAVVSAPDHVTARQPVHVTACYATFTTQRRTVRISRHTETVCCPAKRHAGAKRERIIAAFHSWTWY
jgi:hypothetical protein